MSETLTLPSRPIRPLRILAASRARRLAPYLAAVGVAVIGALLSWQVRAHDRSQVRAELAVAAAGVRAELENELRDEVLAFTRLSERWPPWEAPASPGWRRDTARYMDHSPALQALAWLDREGSARWWTTREGSAGEGTLAPWLTGAPPAPSGEALERGRPLFGPPVGPAGSGRLLPLAVPLPGTGEPEGLLLALLDSGELLDEILADQLLMGYGVDVSLYGIPVYRAGVAATGAMPRQWLESTPMELHGAPWSLRVWPSAGLLEQKRSWAPAAVLTSSLLLAVAFGAGTKLTRDARERARDLEAAQRDLDRMQHLVNDLPACSRVGTRDARSLRYAVERQRFEPTLADHHAHLGGVMGVALDVTECEEAETALRASEERYRQFFEEDLTGDCIVDLEGRIHDCNPAFARTFGFGSVREALASDVPTLVPDREVRRRVLRDFHREGQLERYGFEARKTTGEPVYLIANAVAVHDEAGRVRQIRAYLFDDTERHQTEAQLRQSQKMEAVGRLAGGVAHDFNNLVTAINGYSDLLLARLRDDAPERTELEEIRRAGQRAAALTRQLLAFSRSQVLRPTVLDLNEVIDATGAMLHRLLGEDIRLVTRLTEDLAPVRADRGQLEQVLLNLAVNAQDAMPRGGELLVETSEEELDGTYVKRNVVVHPGTFVTLTVTDTGEGMPPDVLERVFEPFFTTKDSGKGTGLGLSTVYGIVKQTGGYIFGYSEPGEGTSFKVYLPRADTPVEANPLAETVATDQGRGERILVVEDEDAVRSLIGQILRLQGYDVIEAPNGRRGLEACSNGGRFDLVVTDVVMPDVRGPDLERQIRKVLPDVPMLFISGYPGEAIARRGELPEGTPFLQKPFTHDALTRKVRELLG